MKKLLYPIIVIAAVATVQSTFAALSVVTTPVDANNVKVSVMSDSADKLSDVSFSVGYDSTNLEAKDLKGGNVADGTPTSSDSAVTYSGVGTGDSGAGTVAEFTLTKKSGVTDSEFLVGLENATVNGASEEGTMASASFGSSTESVATTATVSGESVSGEVSATPVNSSTVKTSTKTGPVQNILLASFLLLVASSTLYFKNKKATV